MQPLVVVTMTTNDQTLTDRDLYLYKIPAFTRLVLLCIQYEPHPVLTKEEMAQIKGFLCVLGGVIVQLTLSTYYTWANMAPYVISYVRKYSNPYDIDYSSAAWITSLFLIGEGLSFGFVGLIEEKIGTRLVVALGSAIFSIGVFLSAFTIRANYYLFLITYGLFGGIGAGFAYVPTIIRAVKWFPNNQGLVTGIIIAGFGASSLVFDQVQTDYINPSNVETKTVNGSDSTDRYFMDDSVLNRVPSVLMVLSACYTIMQIMGVILLFPVDDNSTQEEIAKDDQPEKLALLPIESDEDELHSENDIITEKDMSSAKMALNAAFAIDQSTQSATLYGQSAEGCDSNNQKLDSSATKYWNISAKSAILQRPFITLWLMTLLFCSNIAVFSALYKIYGENLVVNDDHFLAIVGSMAGVGNFGGKILWGLLQDKTSVKAALSANFAITTILLGTIYISHAYAEEAGRPLLMIWVFLFYLTAPGAYTLAVSAIPKVFGLKHSTTLCGVLLLGEASSGIPCILIGTFLLPLIHYFGIFIFLACLSTIGFFLGLSFNVKKLNGDNV